MAEMGARNYVVVGQFQKLSPQALEKYLVLHLANLVFLRKADG
jgi:hypothetical protein